MGLLFFLLQPGLKLLGIGKTPNSFGDYYFVKKEGRKVKG